MQENTFLRLAEDSASTWIAKLPTPPAPACTSTFFPCSPPSVTPALLFKHANAWIVVSATSGTEPASTKSTDSGTFATNCSGIAANSAEAPHLEDALHEREAHHKSVPHVHTRIRLPGSQNWHHGHDTVTLLEFGTATFRHIYHDPTDVFTRNFGFRLHKIGHPVTPAA